MSSTSTSIPSHSFLVYWQHCLQSLQQTLPEQQFTTWINPLRYVGVEGSNVQLHAPNRFIKDWVEKHYLHEINQQMQSFSQGRVNKVLLCDNNQQINHSVAPQLTATQERNRQAAEQHQSLADSDINQIDEAQTSGLRQAYIAETQTDLAMPATAKRAAVSFSSAPSQNDYFARPVEKRSSPLNALRSKSTGLVENYTFDSFVEGSSNQLARAAAQQVAENPGSAYNPLFLYGGVGLGKTHLMHAIGNRLKSNCRDVRVVYMNSERFVADMVKALQMNAINDFKRFYRSIDALLIDDIQFFAGKEHSQEEFFHTFNALLENGQQIILTSDRFPKELSGLEERLRSRFGWGLTVEVQPPELETRVAILLRKAQENNMVLNRDVAFFIAQRIRANVRDLEGALKRIKAQANITGRQIDQGLVQDALRDLFSLQDRLVNIANIQKTVAEYFKIKLAELLSKRRNRSLARPRQIAMALAKELTSHSLPEIGESFGGRDHTTVLHACRKIEELRKTHPEIQEDYKNLQRLLTT